MKEYAELENFIRKHYAALYTSALKFVKSEAVAQDIVQEIIIRYWENQEKYKGGWIRKINGNLQPRMGNRAMLLGKIFANPHLPGIDDYYEPFDFDYQNLHTAPEGSKSQPIARPRSLITGERMAKIEKGPNWEDDLGGEFDKIGRAHV